jgi:hypothetical protein
VARTTTFERARFAVAIAALVGCGARPLGVGLPGAPPPSGPPADQDASGAARSPGPPATSDAGPIGSAGASAAGSSPASAGVATRADGTCVTNAFKRSGVCTCEVDIPDVCRDTCVSLSSDPDNCGACGQACAPTAVCVAGRCGPSVSNVVPAAAGCGSLELAVADGALFWTDRAHGTVERLSLGASAAVAPTTIATHESNPGLIAVSGSNVFWIDDAPTATLRQGSTSGGAPIDLATETNTTSGIRGVAVSGDGLTVYYSAGTKVKGVPVGGGAPFDVGQEMRGGLPTALGIEGGTIGYVAALNGTVDVITANGGATARCGDIDPTDGTLLMVDCERLGGCTPEAFTQRFFVRERQAYWANGADVHVGPAGTGPTAGWQQVTSTLFGGPITGLAMGPDSIYFAEKPDVYPPMNTGFIEKAALAPSSTAIPVARGQAEPGAMAVDATNVYWATSDCAINTIAR